MTWYWRKPLTAVPAVVLASTAPAVSAAAQQMYIYPQDRCVLGHRPWRAPGSYERASRLCTSTVSWSCRAERTAGGGVRRSEGIPVAWRRPLSKAITRSRSSGSVLFPELKPLAAVLGVLQTERKPR